MEKKLKKADSSKELTKDSRVNEKASLDSLNDDCLIQIFNNLPICDRFRLQRVNKRWRSVSQSSWSSLKKLDFSKELWGFFGNKWIDNASLAKVLTQCGRYLTHFEMDTEAGEVENYRPLVFADMDFQLFKLTPNLTNVDFAWKVFTAENVKIFIEHCKNIERISFDSLCTLRGYDAPDFRDIDIDQIIEETAFRTYKNLRAIKFCNCDFTGSCLKAVSHENIEELKFSYCRGLKTSTAIDFISKCQKLKKLRLQACSILDDLPDLILPSNVRNLNISKNSEIVTNNFLKSLSKSCQNVSTLNISGNYNLTDIGVAHLSSLPNLEHLYVSRIISITGKAFANMFRLKTLTSRENYNLAPKYLESLLKGSDQLQLLDVSYCGEIEKSFITTAIKYLQKRENSVSLTIILHHIDRYPVTLPSNLKLILGD